MKFRGIITKVDFSKRPFRCEDERGDTIIANTVIICTGASANISGFPMRKNIADSGKRVRYMRRILLPQEEGGAVVGGGDTACEEALYSVNTCGESVPDRCGNHSCALPRLCRRKCLKERYSGSFRM